MAWTATPILPPTGQLGWRAPLAVTQTATLMQATARMFAPNVSAAVITVLVPPSMVAVAVFKLPTLTVQPPPIAVPLLAANAAMATPLVKIDPPPVTAVIMLAAAQFRTPTLSVGDSITSAVLHAVAAMLTPGVLVGTPILPPTIQAIAAMPTPTVAAGASITSPLLAAIAAMRTPTISAAIGVSAPLLAATAAMLAPTLGTTAPVISPLLAATALMPPPAITISAGVTSPVLAAIAAMPAPTISMGTSIPISAALMPATAAMRTPTLGVGASLAAPVLAATAAMPTPAAGLVITVNVPPPAQVVYDDFQRADSTTSLGPNWTHKSGAPSGISGNTAYSTDTTGSWSVDQYNALLSTDDMDVSVTVGGGSSAGSGDGIMVLLGCNAVGEGALVALWNMNNPVIYTQTTWGFGGLVQQVNVTGLTFGIGDVLTLRRRGNVYTVLRNGINTACSWTDSTNVVPIDSNHRAIGIGLDADSTSGRRATFFQASNVPLPVLTDYFVRADSTTSAGPNWTNQLNALGIQGNDAYPPTAGTWAVASYNTPLLTDDADVSVTYGACSGTSDRVVVWLGCNAAGEGVQATTDGSNAGMSIWSQTSWGFAGLVQRAYIVLPFATGDVLTFRRRGNVYTAYKNGVDVGCTWTDTSNVVPRDANHRYVGLAGLGDAAGPRYMTAFEASNIGIGGIMATATMLAPTVKIIGGRPRPRAHQFNTTIKRTSTR